MAKAKPAELSSLFVRKGAAAPAVQNVVPISPAADGEAAPQTTSPKVEDAPVSLPPAPESIQPKVEIPFAKAIVEDRVPMTFKATQEQYRGMKMLGLSNRRYKHTQDLISEAIDDFLIKHKVD